ncbi:MAG: BrnT family toxin [Proteobacteria bacterium]|nr:BrnT family toxin [Pseudomonadota bacterium]
MLLFEWDPEKATKNQKIHGITFDEASTVFKDILSLTIYDPLHSENENRFILIGNSHKNRLLVIVHTERGDRIRIISARKAKKNEREYYEENAKRSGHAGRI